MIKRFVYTFATVLALALVFAALPANCWAESQPKANRGRPNIIIVMADDMGFSDLGCYGGEIKTPVIDRLATEGVRFSQFYNCALCGPSRASLMTGCYPWDVGQTVGTSIFDNLKKNCATVMELLKANGYATCAVGRLDMVTGEDWHDPGQVAICADRFLGSASGGPGNYFRQAKGTPWFKDGKKYDRPVGKYSTDLISDFAADFIEESAKSDKPFFIYVSHYAPHWPLQAKVDAGLIPEGTTLHDSMLNPKPDAADRELATERMAIHAAMVESIDRSLADTMAALEKAGKLDNTLILVFSDNGASHQLNFNRQVPPGVRPGSMDTFLNHGAALAAMSNTPFRNYKTSNYEGGIASPLIAGWPRGLKGKGRVSHVPCHIVDIMPTCMELANIRYPSRFQGRNLIPLAGKSFSSILYDTERKAPRVMVWPKAVRDGDWKLETGTGKEAVAGTVQDQSGQKREEEPGGRIPRSGFETEADPRESLFGTLGGCRDPKRKQMAFDIPTDKTAADVKLKVSGKRVDSTYIMKKNRVVVTPAEPAVIEVGQNIEIRIQY